VDVDEVDADVEEDGWEEDCICQAGIPGGRFAILANEEEGEPAPRPNLLETE